jgi:hypothetical protein
LLPERHVGSSVSASRKTSRPRVIVLDVNAKFGPWLVERERLFAAMDTLDGERKRGLLLVR